MNFRNAVLCGMVLLAATLSATIFGTIRGLIHDPQHRPVPGAQVTLRAADSDFNKVLTSDDAGEFRFDTIPLGQYTVTVEMPGFAPQRQRVTLNSGSDAKLHFSIVLAAKQETVEVTDQPPAANSESSTTSAVISREQIANTPGADQTNSMAMITNYTPGAYLVHDQLHIRGGHQVSWLLDGVPVPNTNIASNVGPQFDPKDIDYVEVQRGGLNAEYGDRTYGVFNVVTRSGFERNHQAELVASYGSYNNTNNQISFGDHSERFAYYGSLSGYRTDLGLETPIAKVINDQAAGLSAFASLIFNKTPSDQLRFVTSLRGDHYQVPVDPAQTDDAGNPVITSDVENERDDFLNFSWLHTSSPGTVWTISPFYHFNRARYIGGLNDRPTVTDDDRGSSYFGGTASVGVNRRKHNLRAGFQTFGQHDNEFFGLITVDGSLPTVRQRQIAWGSVGTIFLEDQYKATSWLTVNGGVRLTHFEGAVSENAADPRIGAAVRIPKLGWVARAFWGRYYQAPPLQSVCQTNSISSPNSICNAAQQQGLGFLPLRGEGDEQREFGLTIPLRGWSFDVATFRTGAKNFFDHDVIGNSNLFFPLTIDRARIHGWEATASSPSIGGHARFHLVYSHQYAEGRGGVTGGLTDFQPPDSNAYFFLDHDQRDTLSSGVDFALPWRLRPSFAINYGSGFLDGEGPAHLPSHLSYDFSVGKSVGENWDVRLTALNFTNKRYMLDNSNTFGGSHFANPRELAVQLRYRFRF